MPDLQSQKGKPSSQAISSQTYVKQRRENCHCAWKQCSTQEYRPVAFVNTASVASMYTCAYCTHIHKVPVLCIKIRTPFACCKPYVGIRRLYIVRSNITINYNEQQQQKLPGNSNYKYTLTKKAEKNIYSFLRENRLSILLYLLPASVGFSTKHIYVQTPCY